MASIVVKNITFGEKKFRKLKSMTIPISKRLTIIAGHNGIGKSTILALLAHPSGLTKKQHKSFFDRTFQANFNEIIHIDVDGDYKKKLGPPKELSEPTVTYCINATEDVTKACRLGPRGAEVRIVARNVKPSTSKFTSSDGSIIVGPAQKVPLPTIYLGMTRVLPIGEAQSGTASSASLNMHKDDSKLMSDFFNEVIPGGNTSPNGITRQRIKDTGKISGQPRHTFDPRCVSVGQDSLGSIALALASFNKLKRDWSDYPGGLLIIDEIDAGLHPHAIGGLIKQLKSISRTLQLQIVATTHSPKLIEAVHPDSEPNNPQPIDSVVYIRDTGSPKLMEDPSLKQIIADMNLTPPGINTSPPPIAKVYFEDEEAASFFHAIVSKELINELSLKYQIKLDPLPLGLGCENLSRLADYDPYFENVVIVLDADSVVDKKNIKNANICNLPGGKYSAPLTGDENKDIVGRPLSPERTLLQFINNIVNMPDDYGDTLNSLSNKDVTTDYLRSYLLDSETTVLSKREQTKYWWKSKKNLIDDWGLLKEWVAAHSQATESFLKDFETSVSVVAKRLIKKAVQR